MSQGISVDSRTASNGIAWWLRAAIILGALLMAAGGIIALVNPAMLVSPHEEINGAVHVYAGYLASRNLVLAVMLLVMLALRARRALSYLMVLTAFIQFADAGIDWCRGAMGRRTGSTFHWVGLLSGRHPNRWYSVVES